MSLCDEIRKVVKEREILDRALTELDDSPVINALLNRIEAIDRDIAEVRELVNSVTSDRPGGTPTRVNAAASPSISTTASLSTARPPVRQAAAAQRSAAWSDMRGSRMTLSERMCRSWRKLLGSDEFDRTTWTWHPARDRLA